MSVNRVIPVSHGDPLEAVQQFLTAWWRLINLDALLAPVAPLGSAAVATVVIDDPARLAEANPFAPAMFSNAAALVGDFARHRRGQRLAAILRPCELRTFQALKAQHRLPPETEAVTLVGVDCAGTYAIEDYAERVCHRGTASVTREILTFVGDGHYASQQFRTACQACDWPAPRGADVVIGTIGVHPDEYLLVIARDEATDNALRLPAVAAKLATESQIVRREVGIGTIADQHARARANLQVTPPTAQRLGDLGTVLGWLERCSLCGDCLDACPLYNGELASLMGVRNARPALTELIGISRWLAACSGCGMCEAACAQQVPITRLVTALSHQIRAEHEYLPGATRSSPSAVAG